MENCSRYPNNPYCFCTNVEGKSTPQYKQFNANSRNIGVGYNCCNKLNYQPSYIANTLPYVVTQFENVYNYIITITASDNRCEYDQYFGGYTGIQASLYLKNNYPDLYNYSLKSMQIFNSFYCKEAYINTSYYSSIVNNNDLIPVIDGKTVRCPLSGFIPRLLSYQDGVEQKDEYLYICFPSNLQYPNLQNTDYSILSIYDQEGKNAKTNLITTQYGAANNNSVGSQIHNNKPKIMPTWEIAVITIATVLILIIIGVILYKVIEKNKYSKNFI